MTHRPFVAITILFIIGIVLEKFLRFPFWWLCGPSVVFLLLGLWLLNKNRISIVFLSVVFVLLGAIFVQNHLLLPKDHINRTKWYERKDYIEIKGVVVSDVQKRPYFKGSIDLSSTKDHIKEVNTAFSRGEKGRYTGFHNVFGREKASKTSFTLEAKALKTRWGWKKRSGKILVNVFRDTDTVYGDFLLLKGKLHRPFNYSASDNFSYKDYLEQRGIKYILSVGKQGKFTRLDSGYGTKWMALSLKLKQRLNGILTEYLSPHEAALVSGMILGDRYAIPQHIRDLFVQTGTAHILAISGFNVGIVAFLIFLVVRAIPIGRKNQYLVTIAFLIFYAFLVGGQPSVVRATIMGVVFLLSFLVEREIDPVNTLAFSALVILMVNPLNLYDIGFQLSFISVLAIIKFYSPILRWISKAPFDMKRQPFLFVAQSLSVSLAAECGIAVLIAYYFNIVTPVTVAANLFIIPLMSVIVALGMGLLAAGLLWPGGVFVFAACIKLILNVTVGIIYLLSQCPGAYFYIPQIPLWPVLVYYGSLLAIYCWIRRKEVP